MEKRIFKTSGGTKLNISFISAYVIDLYTEYSEAFEAVKPDLLAQQERISDIENEKDILSSKEKMIAFNELMAGIRSRVENVNRLALELILTVLEGNAQTFEVTGKEIKKRMSLNDMLVFIIEACTVKHES